MDFKNLDEVKAWFENAHGNRNNNNYFFAFKDLSKVTGPAAFLGGAVGALAAGIAAGMNSPYDAVIVNSTEEGLGILYLEYNGVSLVNNINKLHVKEDAFFFINNENIKSVTIKKLAPLNNKIKKVCIETDFGMEYNLQVNVEEKTIPYHKEGFAEFMAKYGSK